MLRSFQRTLNHISVLYTIISKLSKGVPRIKSRGGQPGQSSNFIYPGKYWGGVLIEIDFVQFHMFRAGGHQKIEFKTLRYLGLPIIYASAYQKNWKKNFNSKEDWWYEDPLCLL